MLKSVRNELRLGSSICAIVATVGAASAQDARSQAPAAGPPGDTGFGLSVLAQSVLPYLAVTAPKQTSAAAPPGDTDFGPSDYAQSVLPNINITAPSQTHRRTAAQPRTGQQNQPATPPTQEQVEQQANEQVVKQTTVLDTKRDEVLQPKTGATVTTLTQRDLESVPQGSNIAVSDLVYQLPGVSQDSTSSGDFHVRNDHANVQYRINGIQMPDGVSGFSQFLETNLFQSFSLITGALPAQYGLHTVGVLDITTKSGEALSGGNVSVYGGSYNTLTPSFEYGGVKGNTEYFVTGRFLNSDLGLENPTGSINANHDHTDLGRFFSYTSTLLDQDTRFVTFAGFSDQTYQIPTNPGQQANVGGFTGPNGSPYSAFGVQPGQYSSSQINQNQYETNEFFVAAWQRALGDVDMQVSYYNRYSELHFVPDPVGDLLFNNIATDVLRKTFVNGVQSDFSYKVNDQHTLRAGFIAQGEQTEVSTLSTVEPLLTATSALDAPFNVNDSSSLFGWQLGLYAQDEWKLTPTLTLNYGLRYDQIWQYVNADQVSPRASLQWQPWWATLMHVGYSRNFTPPDQDLGRPTQPQLLAGTTGFPAGSGVNGSGLNSGPILPERADVYDVGIVQQLLPRCPTPASGTSTTKASPLAPNCPALEVGVDAYYKYATDLIDDGQFGQAYLLSAFNYAKGIVEGIEFKGKFTMGNFTLYSNWSTGFEKANTVVSNQSFFTEAQLAYIANNWIYTDHTQLLTGSAGMSYLFTGTDYSWLNDTKVSSTMIYGSGLRADGSPVNVTVDGTQQTIAAPNGGHVPAYTQVNLGLSHEFKDSGWDPKPFTLRFDIVNLFDDSYVIRNGTGIGVFAPQFGPRRGYFFGFTQKL
jgi:outer membrane receptor protein involved in Fe transport